jgi:hypothetical protein
MEEIICKECGVHIGWSKEKNRPQTTICVRYALCDDCYDTKENLKKQNWSRNEKSGAYPMIWG